MLPQSLSRFPTLCKRACKKLWSRVCTSCPYHDIFNDQQCYQLTLDTEYWIPELFLYKRSQWMVGILLMWRRLLDPVGELKFKRSPSSKTTRSTGLTTDRLCWMLMFNVLRFTVPSFHGIQDSSLRFLVSLTRLLAVASLQAVRLP